MSQLVIASPACFPVRRVLSERNASRREPRRVGVEVFGSPSEVIARSTVFTRLRQFAEQPGSGMGPIIFGRARGKAEHFRGFIVRHADEIAQLHQFGFGLVRDGEFVERLVDGQELVVDSNGGGQIHILNVHPLLIATVTQRLFAPGAVNENAAHRLGSGPEEVCAAIPLLILVTNQPQPGFVNQCGRLQGLARRFVRHLVRGEAAQFFIDQRQQLPGGSRIALLSRFKNARDVAHGCAMGPDQIFGTVRRISSSNARVP